MKIRIAAFFALAAFGVASTAIAAQGDQVGETQMCVDANRIDQSPVIDRTTILLDMRGPGFKRIDLMKGCGLDRMTGFAFDATVNRLCIQTPLHVLDNVGGVCMIDKIVTIDATEAKALLKRK